MVAWETLAVGITAIVVVVCSLEFFPALFADTDDCPLTSLNCPNRFFSDSYLEARHKFRTSAKMIDAPLESYLVARDTATGVDLRIDVAFVAGSTPESTVVHVSGVHGVEGFAGSAIQVKALQTIQRNPSGLVDGPNLVFIHAVNPYGMHNLRRVNENGVDMNRNFLDDAGAEYMRSVSTNWNGYEDWDATLNPTMEQWWDVPVMLLSALHFIPYTRQLKLAITGQYHNPHGIMYGGKLGELEPSVKWVHEVAKKYLSPRNGVSNKRSVFIDVHTGLGKSGQDILIVGNATVKAARDVLPSSADRVVVLEALYEGQGVASHPRSDFVTLQQKILEEDESRECVYVFQEFGTRPGPFVLAALVIENAAHHHAHPGSSLWRLAKRMLSDAFYVRSDVWKRSILDRGIAVLQEARDRG